MDLFREGGIILLIKPGKPGSKIQKQSPHQEAQGKGMNEACFLCWSAARNPGARAGEPVPVWGPCQSHSVLFFRGNVGTEQKYTT